jgi:hypothetical protein
MWMVQCVCATSLISHPHAQSRCITLQGALTGVREGLVASRFIVTLRLPWKYVDPPPDKPTCHEDDSLRVRDISPCTGENNTVRKTQTHPPANPHTHTHAERQRERGKRAPERPDRLFNKQSSCYGKMWVAAFSGRLLLENSSYASPGNSGICQSPIWHRQRYI